MARDWDPAQYERFRRERAQPFEDLFALVRPREAMRVIDLGCGTGELTALLAERLPGATVHGVDSSPAMLEKAGPRTHARLDFALADAGAISDFSAWDLVFSNAALHWIPDHEAYFARLLSTMKPGAQLAVQTPRNERHPSHAVAHGLAREEPFRAWLGGFVHETPVLPLERYAALLHQHGFDEPTCIEKVYGHVLPGGADDVVEWVRGTTLVPYLGRLAEVQQEQFLAEYRARLGAALEGESEPGRPLFFPFRRVLFHGTKR